MSYSETGGEDSDLEAKERESSFRGPTSRGSGGRESEEEPVSPDMLHLALATMSACLRDLSSPDCLANLKPLIQISVPVAPKNIFLGGGGGNLRTST